MNAATKLLAKYDRLAEIAHKCGAYECAAKWSLKAEKLEVAIEALKKVEEEKVMSLVELQGSEKQIAWAEKIREDKLTKIKELVEKDPSIGEMAEKAIEFLGTKSNSKWWIENRDNSSSAFLAYAAFYEFNEKKIEYNSYQCAKTNGEITEEKLVATTLSVLDLSNVKSPVKTIDSLKIESTYNEDETISYRLSSTGNNFLKTNHSRIQPLEMLMPLGSGWASQSIECVVIKTYKNHGTNKYRIFGEDINCCIFVKVKEFAKVD